MLRELAEAITPDWHGTRAAGRAQRHVEILRDVAHAISSSADRPDRPASAEQAEIRLKGLLSDLQASAPRTGLGAPTGHFVDHLVKLAGRYGSNLFVCFDDPRVPPTTNELEGFFGEVKATMRRANGRGSTANTLGSSLGAEFLIAHHHTRDGEALLDVPVDPAAFTKARSALDRLEAPARRRRSLVRSLDDQLEILVDRWRASPASGRSVGAERRVPP